MGLDPPRSAGLIDPARSTRWTSFVTVDGATSERYATSRR